MESTVAPKLIYSISSFSNGVDAPRAPGIDMMPHIAILMHSRGSFGEYYYLHGIAEIWSEKDFKVTVLPGPDPAVEADLAVLHVDLTVVPEDHLEFVRRFPVVINGRVADISKRRISAHLVREGDGYDGPVIIKADRNWRGKPEAQLAAKGLLPESDRRILREYVVFDSPRQVPPAIWQNPLVVVERFLPERRDGLYCLRMWKFLGDRETNVMCYSVEPIVKSSNVIRREPVTEVPDELRQVRTDLGFDFGKFDYVMIDGRAVLYDVNRTPSIPHLPKEQILPELRALSEGIRVYLRAPGG